MICCVSSPYSHQRKRMISISCFATLTWWYIACISAIADMDSWRNLVRTPSIELVKSGPWSSWPLSDIPLKLALQSNTTLKVPFLGWCTTWCGMHQTSPSFPSSWFWYPLYIAFIYDVTKKLDVLFLKHIMFLQFPFQAEDPFLSNKAVLGHDNIIFSER